MGEQFNQHQEDERLDEKYAEVAAEAERPLRDAAREEGVTAEEKNAIDRAAGKRGEKAVDVFREKELEKKEEGVNFLSIPEYVKINEPPVSELLEAAQEGDKNAQLFFAHLQLFEVARKYPECDPRFLLGAAKEVSRGVTKFLYDNKKKTPKQVEESLCEMAELFNSHTDSRFSVQVPRIGSSVDRNYMAPARQSAYEGGVKKIITWAVRNDKGIAEYKAEVE